MSTAEMFAVFAGIPLSFYAVFAILVYAPSARRCPRYRPGQAWPHDPVWYAPAPGMLEASMREQVDVAASAGGTLSAAQRPAQPAGANSGAGGLPAGAQQAVAMPLIVTAKGGAHGEW